MNLEEKKHKAVGVFLRQQRANVEYLAIEDVWIYMHEDEFHIVYVDYEPTRREYEDVIKSIIKTRDVAPNRILLDVIKFMEIGDSKDRAAIAWHVNTEPIDPSSRIKELLIGFIEEYEAKPTDSTIEKYNQLFIELKMS